MRVEAFVEGAMITKWGNRGDRKKYLVTLAISFIPEIYIALIVGRILDLEVWKVWLMFQAIVLVIEAFRGAIGYAAYRTIWRNGIVDYVTDLLSKEGYPNPKKYPYSSLASDYFHNVMMDDEIEISTRLDAAQAFGGMFYEQGIFKRMQLESTWSDAISKYQRIKFGGRDYSEDPR
jgi:hypothetical protein